MGIIINWIKKAVSVITIIFAAICTALFIKKGEKFDVKIKKDIDAVISADPKSKPSISKDFASRV